MNDVLPHDQMMETARIALAGDQRRLRAIDAIDRAWRDSPEPGPAQLIWRQIDYLNQAGFNVTADTTGTIPIEPPKVPRTYNTKRPTDIL